MVEKGEITKKILSTKDLLFDLVINSTVNELSDNILYYIKLASEFVNHSNQDIEKEKYHTLDQIVEIIFNIQDQISWIDLEVINTNIERTIIKCMIVDINKTDQEINYHCAIQAPPSYDYNTDHKYDLNELTGC